MQPKSNNSWRTHVSKISVMVSPKGETTINVNGVAGPGCADLTRFLKEGEEIESTQRTSEFYDKPGGTEQTITQ